MTAAAVHNPFTNRACGCIIIKQTLVRFFGGGAKMTERQKRMKELLMQSDAEITDRILSDVLAKFGTRPVGSDRPDPAQEVCPSFPKS